MTNPQQHLKPSPKQLRYLRVLADLCGESFAPPRTKAEASEEIERLQGRKRMSPADRRREDLEVSRRMSTDRGDAASIRDDELVGYGSSATYA